MVGILDGSTVGLFEGCTEGERVGSIVGVELGVDEGSGDGLCVGDCDGIEDGSTVGSDEGAEVGAGLVLGKKSELVRRSGADGPHPNMPDRRAARHRSGCGKVVSAPSES